MQVSPMLRSSASLQAHAASGRVPRPSSGACRPRLAVSVSVTRQSTSGLAPAAVHPALAALAAATVLLGTFGAAVDPALASSRRSVARAAETGQQAVVANSPAAAEVADSFGGGAMSISFTTVDAKASAARMNARAHASSPAMQQCMMHGGHQCSADIPQVHAASRQVACWHTAAHPLMMQNTSCHMRACVHKLGPPSPIAMGARSSRCAVFCLPFLVLSEAAAACSRAHASGGAHTCLVPACVPRPCLGTSTTISGCQLPCAWVAPAHAHAHTRWHVHSTHACISSPLHAQHACTPAHTPIHARTHTPTLCECAHPHLMM